MARGLLFLSTLHRSRQSTRSRKGATAVEMALLTPVFFMLLIGITEICLVLTAQQLIENAAFNASRLAKTGYVNGSQTQTQTVLQVVTNELSSYGSLIDTSKLTTSATSYSSFSNAANGTGGTNGYGSQQQIVVYTINYPWTLFTPMMGQLIGSWSSSTASWVLNLTTRVVVRNEPYG